LSPSAPSRTSPASLSADRWRGGGPMSFHASAPRPSDLLPVDLKAIPANLPFYNCVQQSSILEFGADRCIDKRSEKAKGEVAMKLARLMCGAAIGALALAGMSSAAF